MLSHLATGSTAMLSTKQPETYIVIQITYQKDARSPYVQLIYIYNRIHYIFKFTTNTFKLHQNFFT